MPVEFKEKCGICEAPISCWGYGLMEEYDETKGCTGVQCDFANSSGCFKHYCEDCFRLHTCPVHKGLEK